MGSESSTTEASREPESSSSSSHSELEATQECVLECCKDSSSVLRPPCQVKFSIKPESYKLVNDDSFLLTGLECIPG